MVRFLAEAKDLSLVQEVQTFSEAHRCRVQSTPCPGVKPAVLGLNTHIYLALGIRMRGATPPLLYSFAACAWTTLPLHLFRRLKGPRLTDIKHAKRTSLKVLVSRL